MFPGFRELAALRAERQSNALYQHIGMLDLQRRLLEAVGPVIAAGPFAGMRYLDSSSGSVLGAKLLGSYEAELHGVVAEVCGRQADVVIDIGAAEGYYAAGFARFAGGAPRVVAFEGNFIARRRLAKLARLNGVRVRVEIRGFASHGELRHSIESAKRPVVWCDIEGGEHELLDPAKVAGLEKAMIVFETHEGFSGQPAERILERFAATHAVERIGARERVAAEWFPVALGGVFTVEEQSLLINELRAVGTDWAVLRPR